MKVRLRALVVAAMVGASLAVPPPSVAAAATGHAQDLGEDVRAFGSAPFFGSTASLDLQQPIVGMTRTPKGDGYWEVASDGGIFSYGAAAFFGSTGAIHLNQPIVGMASTPTGNGYWLVARDGGIFSFGDAHFFGSTGAMHLNAPIIGMAASPTGGGYWLGAADGGIFTFGDATFFGSAGSLNLARPVSTIVARPSGDGYWLIATDGGVFTYGAAPFKGSAAPSHPAGAVIAGASSPTGNGYWLLATDGGVFTFGDAAFFGSLASAPLYQVPVAMAATPDGKGYWIALNGGCLPGTVLGKAQAGAGGVAQSLLTTIDVKTQTGCDTVRFGFAANGPSPVGFSALYARPPFSGPSGLPIIVHGRDFIEVTVRPGSTFDPQTGQATYTGPLKILGPGGSHVVEMRQIESFEGVMRWVIGLDATRPFAAFSPNPQSLFIEIR